jgi:hypothetical protein
VPFTESRDEGRVRRGTTDGHACVVCSMGGAPCPVQTSRSNGEGLSYVPHGRIYVDLFLGTQKFSFIRLPRSLLYGDIDFRPNFG